jgi:hypothetical protein
MFVDIMSINHFALYFGFGALFPGRYMLAFAMSLLWEVFEIALVTNPVLYDLMTKHWIVPERYWNEPAKNKITDVALNMLGYHVGTLVSTRPG